MGCAVSGPHSPCRLLTGGGVSSQVEIIQLQNSWPGSIFWLLFLEIVLSLAVIDQPFRNTPFVGDLAKSHVPPGMVIATETVWLIDSYPCTED